MAVGVNPGDFVVICYTALGRPLEQLVTGSDARTDPGDPGLSIPWNSRPHLTDRQVALET